MKKNNYKKQNFNLELVSIILPTFNEVENILDLILAIDHSVNYKKEFIIVDDNSPDGTSKAVATFIKKNKKIPIKLETRYRNHGLTNSIKRGIKISKGDAILWLDCDFSMPPSLIEVLLNKIEYGWDISVGSRFVKGGGFKLKKTSVQQDTPLAIILSRLMNFTIQLMLGREFRDYTSGFIAARSNVLKKIKLRGDYGEYFIDLIYKAKLLNYKIVEVGYICIPREKGISKTGKNLWEYFKRGRKYILITIQLLIEKHLLHKIP